MSYFQFYCLTYRKYIENHPHYQTILKLFYLFQNKSNSLYGVGYIVFFIEGKGTKLKWKQKKGFRPFLPFPFFRFKDSPFYHYPASYQTHILLHSENYSLHKQRAMIPPLPDTLHESLRLSL